MGEYALLNSPKKCNYLANMLIHWLLEQFLEQEVLIHSGFLIYSAYLIQVSDSESTEGRKRQATIFLKRRTAIAAFILQPLPVIMSAMTKCVGRG